jgi:hypothetical protein
MCELHKSVVGSEARNLQFLGIIRDTVLSAIPSAGIVRSHQIALTTTTVRG